ncbi:MAG: hypothetical protein R3A44_32305 [Caldilineaceae bacterium]
MYYKKLNKAFPKIKIAILIGKALALPERKAHLDENFLIFGDGLIQQYYTTAVVKAMNNCRILRVKWSIIRRFYRAKWY